MCSPCLHTQVPKRLLERQLPALPALGFNVVDVRDVARAHINGMTVPEAAGNRHILAIRHAWFSDMAKVDFTIQNTIEFELMLLLNLIKNC